MLSPMHLLPLQSETEVHWRLQNVKLPDDRHRSQLSVVHASPMGVRQMPWSVLQLSVAQSLSAAHGPPTSFLGSQPVPGTHRWLLGQPQTSQCEGSAWLHARYAPWLQM
jgi:hypothetical protein